MTDELAIYFHIPFCKTRCSYCDFVSYAGKADLIPAYLEALRREIKCSASLAESQVPVCSLYFGGGTPSLLTGVQIGEVIAEVRQEFDLKSDAEITMEMNPCNVTAQQAEGWRAAGITRASLGMQSGNDSELKLMLRRHTAEDTAAAVETLRKTGIHNISLDLIYGFPTQTNESWRKTLQTAVSLSPSHLSLYALSIEDGCILQKQLQNGKLIAIEDDEIADMYDTAATFLQSEGFEHYEISNWAAGTEYESRHNKQYWLAQPYLGLGAGAHGNIAHVRTINESDLRKYLDQMQEPQGVFPAAIDIEEQSERLEMQDFMMLGLRLLKHGVNPRHFYQRFHRNMNQVFEKELCHLLQKKLVKRDEQGRLILNEADVMVANQAFIEFVD